MNYTASMFHRETVVLLTRATLDRKDPVLYETLSRAIYITRIGNQENNEKREYTIYSVTNSSLIQQISPLYCRHSQTAPVDTVTVIPSVSAAARSTLSYPVQRRPSSRVSIPMVWYKSEQCYFKHQERTRYP